MNDWIFKNWRYTICSLVLVLELLSVTVLKLTNTNNFLFQCKLFMVIVISIIACCLTFIFLETAEFFKNRGTKHQEALDLTHNVLADKSITPEVKKEVAEEESTKDFVRKVLDDPKVKEAIAVYEPFKVVTAEDLQTRID